MRWMIASDIHGSAYYCREMLEAFSREKADRLLLLGDILYHGPRNDLPREYAPKEVFGMLNEYKDRIFCVRGNCDTEVDQMVLEFPILADYCILTCGNRLVYATHGHRFNRNSLPPLQPGDILLHGHTHVPAWEAFGNDNYPAQLHGAGGDTLDLENPGRGHLPRGEAVEHLSIHNSRIILKGSAASCR